MSVVAPYAALLGLVFALAFKGWLTKGVNLDPVPGASAYTE